jgi:DNA recombination protein RmuC
MWRLKKDKAKRAQSELLLLKGELKEERNKVLELNRLNARLEASHRNVQEKLKTQKEEITQMQQRFSLEFKNLANEIFEDKSKKFTDQNKVNIGDLLKPLGEKIAAFEQKVEQSNKDNLERNTALKEQIGSLKELNQRITKEAENLTKALKGDTKAQGSWGEFILESILEKSGLAKDREYHIQDSRTNEEGKRFQPDVVVKLPDNKSIVVDSKVSLIAYERAVNAETEEDKVVNVKAHLLSLKSHIKGLGEKNYQSLYGVESLDFVLMFVPVEPAFSLAVQHDPELFNHAYAQNIVIVSPATLIATLRTIASIWKQENQSRNAIEIAREGGRLYDKFVAFTEDLKSIGKHLDSSQKAYELAKNKLYEGKGNLASKAEKMKELGAKASKSLDKS